MNERIISFLKSNTNLTMATSAVNVPYCANCFYAYDEERNMLVFKSSRETNHIQQALIHPKIAGSVVPDKLETGAIKGIQFQGNFIEPKDKKMASSKMVYYKKYPFARVISGDLWAIELTYIKMTDNTLGFGKKIEWEKK